MYKVRITAIRQTVYPDLIAKYENPIEHTCDVLEGQQWISENGQCPEGLCPSELQYHQRHTRHRRQERHARLSFLHHCSQFEVLMRI